MGVNKTYTPLLLVSGLGLVLILLVIGMYGDLLGARLVKRFGHRINIIQGQNITFELLPHALPRKIEVCREKKVSGVLTYHECQTVMSVLEAKKTTVKGTIPRYFPPGWATIIVRGRNSKGVLPLTVADPKIPAVVLRYSYGSYFNPSPTPGGGRESVEPLPSVTSERLK